MPKGAILRIMPEQVFEPELREKDALVNYINPYVYSYTNEGKEKFHVSRTYSEVCYLEYYEPAKVEFSGELHIQSIYHDFRGEDVIKKKNLKSGSCNANVVCPLGKGWQNEIQATVYLEIKIFNAIVKFTGCLINKTGNYQKSDKPYLLTCAHTLDGAAHQSGVSQVELK